MGGILNVWSIANLCEVDQDRAKKKLQTRHVDIRKLKQRNDHEVYKEKEKTK